jgi:hypothetical protein
MSKRSSDEAGLNEPQKDENNEEMNAEEDHNEQDNDNGSDVDGDENDENNDGNSDDSSDSPPDFEYMRGFALSWLEDKRIDGLTPQAIFESLGMKVVCMHVFSPKYVLKIIYPSVWMKLK